MITIIIINIIIGSITDSTTDITTNIIIININTFTKSESPKS